MCSDGALFAVSIAESIVNRCRLPFRLLVAEYGADVVYTPMIMADSFIHSSLARHHELQLTCPAPPTVVQFAAHTPHELATAVQLVAPYVDGVDLNCGCPQGWAAKEGIGAVLMRDADLVYQMVRQAVSVAGQTPVAVKMRIFDDEKKTVELARRLETAGASWLTVHGRTRHQKSSESVNYAMVKLIKQSVAVPVVANGDAFTLNDTKEIAQCTGADGVMSARGILENPALFSGSAKTPWECVDRFCELSVQYGSASSIFHHHLSKMTASVLSSGDHRVLNSLANACIPSMIDFLEQVRPQYNRLS
ncbi:tRNA-dihydrouridine synthase [Paramicrosporidium saccamoebae]|uniref:tRNA-dihydrouridine synthase n=1 Tax=Paramicrosporidium saccamoebae TaxID=1246581 RepID=A0A2H9TMU7_9FUNG|nr:tRNA-dihydrouridine synthase [Paramicrosporidium saccamoebae]